MTTSMLPRALTLALVACIALACEDRKRAEAVIGVATDLDAPMPLQKVRMTIHRYLEDAQTFVPVDPDLTREWDISGTIMEKFELPNSHVGFSDPDDGAKIMITLFGDGTAKGATPGFVRRRAIFRLVPERTIFVRVPLTSKCVLNADCADHLTCSEGQCLDPEIKNSQLLPTYNPGERPEITFQCDSGTEFRNTSTKQSLVTKGARCPNPNDVCIEGTCYNREAFGGTITPATRPLTVTAQVTDAAGAPITDAQLRLDVGSNSVLRRLRTDPSLRPTTDALQAITRGEAGRFQIATEVAENLAEMQLTVTAPGHAPQIVSIPVKPGINQYVTSVVLFAVREEIIAAGQGRTISLPAPGTTAQINGPVPGDGGTLVIPADRPGDGSLTIRYGTIDPALAPGLAVLRDSSELVQTLQVLYFEAVDAPAFAGATFMPNLMVTTPSIDGAAAEATAYRLDLQGTWRPQKVSDVPSQRAGAQIQILNNGFWSVSKPTLRPGCVRGRIVRPDGSACAGVRVVLRGPTGAASSDATSTDGTFCAPGAQREAATLIVGNTSRNLYLPTSADRLMCGGNGCSTLEDITLDSAADCEQPAMLRAGNVDAGKVCTRSLECRAGTSCYEGHCVSESYARVSITWATSADYDLVVGLPASRDATAIEISENSREIQNVGRLDFEQCADGCMEGSHVENIALLPTAPGGSYSVAVSNFNGAPAGEVRLRAFVAGKIVLDRMVAVPEGKKMRSEAVSITLPSVDQR
jgi:hypothetical protein